MGLGAPLSAVGNPVKAAALIVSRLDRVLTSVERLAVSLEAIERQMSGMRTDIQGLHRSVDGLRVDVGELGGVVRGIRGATFALDQKVDEMGAALEHIDLLARSVPGFRRRARALVIEREPDATAPAETP